MEGKLLHLLNEDEDVESGITVTTYDINRNSYEMKFKYWADRFLHA